MLICYCHKFKNLSDFDGVDLFSRSKDHLKILNFSKSKIFLEPRGRFLSDMHG